ncbi:pheromone-processing carboxypeptidase KEX1-like [Euphorbia lathyris]|uniref:pheromone-processing carboxypeptidase KEX1-like n=1 Tax=Euphorbia lathyris TaxID=212925 RepID=UPI0033144B3A
MERVNHMMTSHQERCNEQFLILGSRLSLVEADVKSLKGELQYAEKDDTINYGDANKDEEEEEKDGDAKKGDEEEKDDEGGDDKKEAGDANTDGEERKKGEKQKGGDENKKKGGDEKQDEGDERKKGEKPIEGEEKDDEEASTSDESQSASDLVKRCLLDLKFGGHLNELMENEKSDRSATSKRNGRTTRRGRASQFLRSPFTDPFTKKGKKKRIPGEKSGVLDDRRDLLDANAILKYAEWLRMADPKEQRRIIGVQYHLPSKAWFEQIQTSGQNVDNDWVVYFTPTPFLHKD